MRISFIFTLFFIAAGCSNSTDTTDNGLSGPPNKGNILKALKKEAQRRSVQGARVQIHDIESFECTDIDSTDDREANTYDCNTVFETSISLTDQTGSHSKRETSKQNIRFRNKDGEWFVVLEFDARTGQKNQSTQ